MRFGYNQIKKTPEQEKAAAKKAAKKARKEKREAEDQAIYDKALEEARIKLEQERLIELEKQRDNKRKEEAAYKAKMEVREKAREKDPAQFPSKFNDTMAKTVISAVNFSEAEFVEETTSSKGTVTRTALKRYTYIDEEFYFDCWVGANIHPNPDTEVGWDPGNSWILEYKRFRTKTSVTNVKIIKGLKLGGTRPEVY